MALGEDQILKEFEQYFPDRGDDLSPQDGLELSSVLREIDRTVETPDFQRIVRHATDTAGHLERAVAATREQPRSQVSPAVTISEIKKSRGGLDKSLQAGDQPSRFPVGGDSDYSNDFGAPRSGGRSHKGIDIFAPRGAPVRAVQGGTLEKVGWNRLGGRRLWIRGDDGRLYYYAHLDSYSPNVQEGARVEPGTVIGSVGNTGNAQGTPPHLHFEVHEGRRGNAINPHPFLQQLER